MQRSGKELTDVEMIDAFLDIVNMTLDCHNNPVREDFQKASRSGQLGYDLTRYLLDHKIIRTGANNQQQRLNV